MDFQQFSQSTVNSNLVSQLVQRNVQESREDPSANIRPVVKAGIQGSDVQGVVGALQRPPEPAPLAIPKREIQGNEIQAVFTPSLPASPILAEPKQPISAADIAGLLPAPIMGQPPEVIARVPINSDSVYQILGPKPLSPSSELPVGPMREVDAAKVVDILTPELPAARERPSREPINNDMVQTILEREVRPMRPISSDAVRNILQKPLEAVADIIQTTEAKMMPQQIQIMEPKKSLKQRIRRGVK